MSDITKRKIGLLGLIGIFGVNLAYMADLVIIPAADLIYSIFNSTPMSVLNFVLSGPQLITIFSALLAPLWMRYMSKKNIIVITFAVFTIAASSGGWISNIYFIASMRAVVGFCGGILMTTAMAFIGELFWDDEKRCSAVMGYYNSSMNLFGIILPIIAGVLCVRQWNYVFFEYLAGIPLLLIMIFFLPNISPKKDIRNDEDNLGKAEQLSVPHIISMLVSIMVIGILYNFIAYMSSVYMAENNLGDASAAGIISSVCCIAGALAGLVFGKAYGKLRGKIVTGIYFLMAVGYLGCSVVINIFWFGICLALMGFAYGASMPYYFAYATTFVPESRNSMVVGLITSCVSVGVFLSTYIGTGLQQILGAEKLLNLCPIYAGISVAGVVCTIIAPKILKNPQRR